jgi:Reverse transcriptase (RNA-dependent DNA polymerase)
MALYVDDLIIACSNQDLCNKLEKRFAGKFKMKILDKVNHILGMDVKVNVPYHTIH